MRYSIELKDRKYAKGCEFLSFAKNIGTHATKFAENLSNNYSQKPLDTAKKSTRDAIKTAETTGDLIDNKIACKTTNISKISSRELHSLDNEANEIEIPKERYIS